MTATTTVAIARTEGERVLGECRHVLALTWREVESATTREANDLAWGRYNLAMDRYKQAVRLYPEAWGR